MKISYSTLLLGLFLLACPAFSPSLLAQPPGMRGGEREERGDREDRGDRGNRGNRGEDRGGWGGDRGRDRGSWGGRDRGGPPGGPGGPGGGRGGFDPSSMIDRLDRNNNGMIDTDEMEGPAQMILARLQREDPSIRTDRPVPVAKIKEAFEGMRRRGGSGDRSDDSSDDSRAQLNDALTPTTLVPGFGEPKVLEPVLGFGPSAELMSVSVTPADQKTAEDLLQRYDRNKDGALAGDEISSRWTGNPLDFDRNGDGKLFLSELAVRAARMRVAQVEVKADASRRSSEQRRERSESPANVPDPYNGRKSFASTGRGLPEGLPGWFAEKDADGDHQVSMAEYSSQWTASLVQEYQKFDLNADGFITAKECLAAIRDGATASGGSAAASSRSDSAGSRGSYGSRSESSGGSAPSGSGGSGAAAASAAQPSPKMLEYAQRIISRADSNKDGALTHDEWKDMLIDPSGADADKDGRVTEQEYAQWLELRSKR